MSAPNKIELERIDTALREWRQGDATLDDGVFLVHLADKRCPLTTFAQEGVANIQAEHNVFEVLSRVHGLVVVTQTCDVVRTCEDREYVEVSPLVQIKPDSIQEIQKRRWPRYAYLPGLADRNLVVDLDRQPPWYSCLTSIVYFVSNRKFSITVQPGSRAPGGPHASEANFDDALHHLKTVAGP